jgi:hypothetical protein
MPEKCGQDIIHDDALAGGEKGGPDLLLPTSARARRCIGVKLRLFIIKIGLVILRLVNALFISFEL